jgi:hypothetical protein
VSHDLRVCHLIATGERRSHELSPELRIDGDRLVYDRGQLSLL